MDLQNPERFYEVLRHKALRKRECVNERYVKKQTNNKTSINEKNKKKASITEKKKKMVRNPRE